MSSAGALASSPFVGLEVPLVEGGSGDLDVGGAFGVAREPVGRAPGRVLGFGGGLMDLGGFDDRGGVRVLVSVAEDFFRGEAERLLGRFDGGSSDSHISCLALLKSSCLHQPRRSRCLSLLRLISLSLLSFPLFLSPSR